MAGMRWDVCTPREYERDGEVKTQWTRIGVAFEGKEGKGPTIMLDALPLPNKEGVVKLMCFEPKEKGERSTSAHGSTAKHHDDSGQVPF